MQWSTRINKVVDQWIKWSSRIRGFQQETGQFWASSVAVWIGVCWPWTCLSSPSLFSPIHPQLRLPQFPGQPLCCLPSNWSSLPHLLPLADREGLIGYSADKEPSVCLSDADRGAGSVFHTLAAPPLHLTSRRSRCVESGAGGNVLKPCHIFIHKKLNAY